MPDDGSRVPGGDADKQIDRDAEQGVIANEITEDHQRQEQANESGDEFNEFDGHPFIPVRHLRGCASR
jgi:hypothetical protein